MKDLSTDELAELRESFDGCDSNGDGWIIVGEFAALLHLLDQDLSEDECLLAFKYHRQRRRRQDQLRRIHGLGGRVKRCPRAPGFSTNCDCVHRPVRDPLLILSIDCGDCHFPESILAPVALGYAARSRRYTARGERVMSQEQDSKLRVGDPVRLKDSDMDLRGAMSGS